MQLIKARYWRNTCKYIEKANFALNKMKDLFTLSEKIISPKKVIYCRVSKEGVEHYST